MAATLNREKLLQGFPTLERYAASALAAVCALAIRLVLDPFLGDRAPYILFFFAIVVVTRLWGRGPGILTTLLAGIGAWYFIIEPRFSFAIASRSDILNLVSYFVVGAGISFLGRKPSRLPSSTSHLGRNIKPRVIRQTAVLAGAIAVLVAMILMLERDFERTQDAEAWVIHTYKLISPAESVYSMMHAAEAGQRDFLLTGDERSLEPYHVATASVPRSLSELKTLTSDNPEQRARCAEIARLADERLGLLQRGIDLARAANAREALALIRTGQGAAIMDSLRRTLDEFIGEERRLSVVRTAAAKGSALRARWVLGLGGGALILLLVMASVVIERETVRREEITQALRRHADLLEQSHDSLLTSRLRGPIDYWSRGAETLFGYTREEALGRSSHDLLHTHHPLGVDQIDARLERDGHWEGELTQTAKDGRELVVEARWVLATDAGGQKTVLEAHHDITERKRAEAERVLLITAIEQASESVVVTDRDASIQYANPAFTGTTGYSRNEAYGRNPRILKSGVHDAQFYRQMWDTLNAGNLWHGEFTNKRKDGTLYMEDATIAPVHGPGGEITHFIAIKSNITERKRAEQALEASELRFRQLFERSASAMAVYEMIFDAQGNPCDFRYVNVNPAFERTIGRVSNQILGRTARELTPDIEDYWIQLFSQVAATGEPSTFEHYALHLGRYFAGSAYALRPNQVAVTFMDVTERKWAEEAVHQLNIDLEARVRLRTADLEAANRELEAFAHSVSHDLRAPLRGIDGWSLALLEDYGERLDTQARIYLDRVRSEAQRMGKLIDDLLHLSRVSRAELAPSAVNLTSLAETIVARLREANPGRSLEFIIAPRLECVGDARLLEAALTNLLDNAVKFTGPRPQARIEFGQTKCNGKPTFFVGDNGVGFDMAYAGMLFAPFQRLHKASEFPGTGIGLATVQRVIHRHGGQIWAEARVGQGATLYFTVGADQV